MPKILVVEDDTDIALLQQLSKLLPSPLAEYARKMKTKPLILTFAGKPIAVLVPVENADLD